jgi:hypothetical protein
MSFVFVGVRNSVSRFSLSRHICQSDVFVISVGIYACIPLVDYDGVRLCLRTAATNGPVVHPAGDM